MDSTPQRPSQINRCMTDLENVAVRLNESAAKLRDRLSPITRTMEQPITKDNSEKEGGLVDLAASMDAILGILRECEKRLDGIHQGLEL